MQVGYIGLGVMGGALAERLLVSRPVKVFDLNEAAVQRLTQAGATTAPSAAGLAQDCDVIFLCLPRSRDVRAVIFGDNGLARGLRPGTIIVDQTSGDPNETRKMAAELAAMDIRMVDAPVSGGAAGAKAGTIAIMVGGAKETVAELRPIFEQISPNIFECGDIGVGQVMKLINNMVSTCNRLTMLEGATKGQRNGLDLSVMCDVLNAGGARGKASENMLPAIVEGVPDSFFLLQLMLKDLNLAVALGTETGVPLQFGQLARGMLQAASNTLGPEANLFDICDYIATEAGTSFKRAT